MKDSNSAFGRIYEVVKKIPEGRVASYGQVASLAGTFPRVVGFALHTNPDPANIPCHRVVFSDGRLSPGYVFGGEGKQKERLLAEGVEFDPKKGTVSRASFLSSP
jgi:methylated-DNA-protein-cysteine methyltransferase-like protein